MEHLLFSDESFYNKTITSICIFSTNIFS